MTQELSLDELFLSRSRRARPSPADFPGASGQPEPKRRQPEPGNGETVSRGTVSGEAVSGGGAPGTGKAAGGRVRKPAGMTAQTVSRETVSSETVTADASAPGGPRRGRPRGRPAAPVGDRWQDRVRRASYYIDVDLLERLDSYCRITDANKSEVVREALEAHLAAHALR